MFIVKFCKWLDLNRGPLVLEATTLPTELQPQPTTSLIRSIHPLHLRRSIFQYFDV